MKISLIRIYFISCIILFLGQDSRAQEFEKQIPCSKKVSQGKFKLLNRSYRDSSSNKLILLNQHQSFAHKIILGEIHSFGYGVMSMALMYGLPYRITNWKNQNPKQYGEHMKRAFTHAPVFDPDGWYINYIGHPYQGSIYYNSVRSQGAKWWQAFLFDTGNILIWEYVIESGNEQPSIQDMLTTPIAGSLLGECIHQATMAMSKNGFRWYEKVLVCVFNPTFAINNGFRSAGKPLLIK